MDTILAVTDPYILLWLVLMIAFIVAEIITVGLISIWFAAGAFSAILVAVFGGHPGVQIVLFLLVSLVLLFATKPWAKKFINAKTQQTNADRLIGEIIRISECVSNQDQTGMANVRGQEWTVRTDDDKVTIKPGESARIIRISGVKLIVEPINSIENKED